MWFYVRDNVYFAKSHISILVFTRQDFKVNILPTNTRVWISSSIFFPVSFFPTSHFMLLFPSPYVYYIYSSLSLSLFLFSFLLSLPLLSLLSSSPSSSSSFFSFLFNLVMHLCCVCICERCGNGREEEK